MWVIVVIQRLVYSFSFFLFSFYETWTRFVISLTHSFVRSFARSSLECEFFFRKLSDIFRVYYLKFFPYAVDEFGMVATTTWYRAVYVIELRVCVSSENIARNLFLAHNKTFYTQTHKPRMRSTEPVQKKKKYIHNCCLLWLEPK